MTADRAILERRVEVLRRLVEVRQERARREKQHRLDHPLAYATLWHAEGIDEPTADWPSGRPRTSQRVALASAPGCDLLGVLGGNGSGKSEAAGQLIVAAALGRDHPDTQAWLARNQLPPEMVPPYPGRVLFSALTGNDSKRILRAKVAKYLPAGAEWTNRYGDGEAFAYPLGEETKDNGGTIVFKSNDQGRDKHQGDEFDLIVGDEEHDEGVVEEWLARMGRRKWKGGYILLTMTPLKGLTWVYRDLYEKPRDGWRVYELHSPDSPHYDLAGALRRYAGLSPARRAARLFGRFAAIVGRVYDAFDRSIHRVPAFVPPSEWTTRYRAVDWGGRAPHVIWAVEDPRGRVVVYRELAPRRAVDEAPIRLTSLLEGIREAEAAEFPPVPEGEPNPADAVTWYSVADSEDPGAINEAAYHGMLFQPAPKGPGSVLRGIELVQAMLAVVDGMTGEEREPSILVTEDCPELIKELEGMRWAPQKVGQDLKPDPSCPDHGPDALRYLCELRKAMGIT